MFSTIQDKKIGNAILLLPSNEHLDSLEEKSQKEEFSQSEISNNKKINKNSFSNPSTKKKSFVMYPENSNNNKLLLPKNHRRIYEKFKDMLTDYDKEDAFKIIESLLESVNDNEGDDEDYD